MTTRLLILEDRPADAELMLAALRGTCLDLEWERVDSEVDYLAALDRRPDLILADFSMSGFDALRALTLRRERGLDIPFIVVSGMIGEDVAVQCMQQGADDYLIKDRLGRLPQAVARALEARRLREEALHTEAALRDAHTRYRLITENMQDAIFLLDFGGRLEFASPRVMEMTGYGPELLGGSLLELFTATGQQQIVDRLARVRQGEPVPLLFETEIVRKDGSRLWVEASVSSVVERGEIVGRLGVVRDISARKRAEEKVSRQEREAIALAKVAALVSRSLDPREVAQLVVDSVCDLLRARAAALYRVTSSGDVVLVHAALRENADTYWHPRLRLGEGVVGLAIREGRAVLTTDAVTDARVRYDPDRRQRLEDLAHRAFVAVPLSAGERWLGVLIVGDRSGRHFGAREVDLAQAFADHAGMAIQNADLFAAAERRATRLHTLTRLSQQVSASLDSARVLSAIARAAAELTGVPLVLFWTVDEGRDVMTLAAISDEALGRSFPLHEMPLAGTVAGAVASDQQRRVVEDVHGIPGFLGLDWWREHRFRSLLGDPIVSGDRLVGVLSLIGRKPFDFDADDEELLGAFRVQAAIALQNASLHGAAQRELAERRRVEQALRDATERLRTVIEASPLAVVTYDRDALVTIWNPAAEHLFGWSAEEARGRALPPVPVEHGPAAAAVRAGVLRGEVFQALDMPLCLRDGTVAATVSSVAPLRDESGRVVGAVVVITDVTERKRTEAALRQSEKLAVMGSLLAGVAHELNNPLAVVLGQAHLLSNRVSGNPGIADRAAKLVSAAERCARVVRNFLALARQRPPERRDVRLNEIAIEAVELLGYPLRVDGIEVDLALAPDLPTLPADQDQLHQVVVNLLTNAHHAMRGTPGPRRLAISTRYDAVSGRAVLEVADSGPGIQPEILPRLFEPFFTTKPAGEGTGLGLSLCRGFVEAHGGTIEALNGPGGGAILRVELPVAGADVACDETMPASVREALSVLVVDDEADVAAVLAELLDIDGHVVEVAGSARAGLDALDRSPFDVVFTDVRMPDLDGSAFYRQSILRHPELARRFVFMTGDSLSAETSRFLAESGMPTLEKPFTLDDIRCALAAVLP